MTPPVFAHGHLRLYLLSILVERPMHGYELIQALEQRFGGTYSPSAGTIYPRLAKLEEEGLVTKSADGRKTVYAITDAGRAELAARESELDDIEAGVTDSVRRLADEVRSSVNDALKTMRADLAAAAREARTATGAAAGNAETSDAARATAARADSVPSDSAGADSARSDVAPSDSARAETARAEAFAGDAESWRRLLEAETALQSFRHQVRADLRAHAAHAPLPAATVALLRTRLDATLAEVRASLLP